MFDSIRIGSAAADQALVFLHGLGASADDVKPFAAALDFPGKERCRIVLPQAPVQPVTLAGGTPLAAWFDVFAVARNTQEDAAGIAGAANRLDALLADLEAQGIARGNIVVGGFSQGGALALHCSCRSLAPPAGCIALSAYLPLRNACPKAARPMPIFMSHGTQDSVLPFDFGAESCAVLKRQGFDVAWHEYPAGHRLHPDLSGDLAGWLSRVFNA